MKLYQNKVKLTINGKEFTNNIPFPIKWNELLDSQLDEASIELLQVEESSFMPLSEAKLEVWNEQDSSRVLTMHYLIASDKADEIPSGSGKFNHSLSLVERTKWLERFVCRSQGYVNSLDKSYVQINLIPQYALVSTTEINPTWKNTAKANIQGPVNLGENTFPSWREMLQKNNSYVPGESRIIYDGSVSIYDSNMQLLFFQNNLDEPLVCNIANAGTYLVKYYCRLTDFNYQTDITTGTTWEIKFYVVFL